MQSWKQCSPKCPILDEASASARAHEIEDRIDSSRLSSDDRYAGVLVELLGATHHADGVPPLLEVAESRADVLVRSKALEHVRGAVQGARIGPKIFGRLLDLMTDPATPKALLGPCTDTLSVIDLPLSHEPRARALLETREVTVRRWAIRALGRLDSAPAARALARVAAEGDAPDRAEALEAVVQTSSGRNALARQLAGVTDPERARDLTRGLRPHSEALTQSTLRMLEQAAIEAPPEVGRVVMELLKQGNGKSVGRVQGNLFDRAIRLKKEGRYADAADIFQRISTGEADAEVRFQLGVCQLLVSKRVLSRGPKKDPCIATLGGFAGQP